MTQNRDRTLDVSMRLKDSGAALTADALATVGGATATLDLGAGFFQGDLVVALEAAPSVDTGDERYALRLIGCNTEAFTTTPVVLLGTIEFGCFETLAETGGLIDVDKGASGGQYILPFDNQVESTTYRFLRLFLGTTGTGLTFDYTAHVAKRQ